MHFANLVTRANLEHMHCTVLGCDGQSSAVGCKCDRGAVTERDSCGFESLEVFTSGNVPKLDTFLFSH